MENRAAGENAPFAATAPQPAAPQPGTGEGAVPDVGRAIAAGICRGTMRLLTTLGAVSLPEVSLGTGRRLDILALLRDGSFTAVEIKSCRADFQADGKWPDYLPWADRFFFAVAPEFPIEILPEAEGLILADRYGGELVRDAVRRPLAPARRKALTLRFARLAAARVQGLTDPDATVPWKG